MYAQLVNDVTAYLRSRDIDVTFRDSSRVTLESFARFQRLVPLQYPPELVRLYLELGDRTLFGWESPDHQVTVHNRPTPADGYFEIQHLSEVARRFSRSHLANAIARFRRLFGKDHVDPSDRPFVRVEWDDAYDFRFTRDPALARTTAIRMRSWIPFLACGNGDSFNLDTALNPAPAIFSHHDWFDGGTGHNGKFVAPSLPDFFRDFAHHCFQFPDPHDANSFTPNGVNWHSPAIHPDFILTQR